VRRAHEEHDALAEAGVEVLYLQELLAEVLADAGVRADLIARSFEAAMVCRRLRGPVREWLDGLTAGEVASGYGSARPRLARRAARGGCDDLTGAAGPAALVGPAVARVEFGEKPPDRSSGGVSGCRGSGRRRGARDSRRMPPSAESVRGGRGPATGACWACRGSASPGHGSRVAAALASVAGKRRLADRARGDVW
jgi:hypothetical protein